MHNKRALTPVLSELLLTIIAVAAMSVATTATYVITTNLRDNMSERVVVEDVWFNNATGTVDIYVHNVGKVDVNVAAVYIDHVSQTFNSPYHMDMNSGGWLNILYSWNPGQTYYVDIVTDRGTHIAGDYKAT